MNDRSDRPTDTMTLDEIDRDLAQIAAMPLGLHTPAIARRRDRLERARQVVLGRRW